MNHRLQQILRNYEQGSLKHEKGLVTFSAQELHDLLSLARGAKLLCEQHGIKNGLFCDECGKELTVQDVIIKDEEPLEVFGDLCPNDSCRIPLEHSHQKRCPKCYTPLKWTCRCGGSF